MVEINAIDESYRRRIEVRVGTEVVEAAMEDYIHHFALRLHHRDGVVTSVDIAPERTPWTTCTEGAIGLQRLVGVRLDEISDLGHWIGTRADQCVHTTDLAVVAAAAACRGEDRTYEFLMSGVGHPQRVATLFINGDEWGTWVVENQSVVDASRSGRFAGMPLERSEYSRWVNEHLSSEDLEPAAVMRRATSIGLGRGLDIDSWPNAAFARPGDDSCHTYRPTVIELSRRNVGTQRETDADPVGTPIPQATRWLG